MVVISKYADSSGTYCVGFGCVDNGSNQTSITLLTFSLINFELNKKRLYLIQIQAFTYFSGERGIRTPGPVTVNGFQDRRIRPLCHLSAAKISAWSNITKWKSPELQLF
jgi:hypothetical protein